MRLLAIDYGTKRIGLATIETSVGVVLPYGICKNSDESIVPQALIDLIATDMPEKIIIGLPLSLENITEQTYNETRVRAFATALQEHTTASIVYVDERFSSQQADQLVGDATRDEKSAMIILETYIQKSTRKNK